MRKQELLTSAEIHHFGVEIVCSRMQMEGFKIIGVNPSPTLTPQIVAKRSGQLCFVIVRTDIYPNKGKLANDDEFFYNLEHAEENGAVCYFASVRICNAAGADARDGKKMTLPVKGADFYVEYEGLKIMTTLDRMEVIEDQKPSEIYPFKQKPALKMSILEKARNALFQR